VAEQITHAIDLFYAEVEAAFRPLAAFCAAQRERHGPLLDRLSELEKAFERLRSRVVAERAGESVRASERPSC
jgi:hypothetical protein